MEWISETRLEFVTEDKLKRMINILGDDVRVEMGFGLENMNEFVRVVCINLNRLNLNLT